jgi:predicted nucleic-acid-binding Zn-ribbon protein
VRLQGWEWIVVLAVVLLVYAFIAMRKGSGSGSRQLSCPKCGGTDSYNNKVRVIKGVGGIYGNRQKEVLKPFCRTCDLEMV